MLNKKIARYKRDIALAKKLKRCKCADQDYYDGLIAKFEKLLKFYEQLKKSSEILNLSNTFQIDIMS